MAGQSARFDDQDDPNASFTKNHEHGDNKLSEVIAGKLESLKPLPSSSRPKHCCIYKVSDHIRKSNELEAYTPQVISIGPFHRDNPKLQKMEDFKLRYLKSFMERARADDPEMNLDLEDLVSTIRRAEKCVRKCYSETITLGSDDFVNMVLLDATFIIEYFWKNKSAVNWTEDDREILKPWLCNRMQMDLILLENQLPFFIINRIYDTAFPSRSKQGHPFIEVCFYQFQYYNVQNSPHESDGVPVQILHFTDLVRNFCMPPRERRPKRSSQNMKEIYSAAQLDEVGLTFKKRESSFQMDSTPAQPTWSSPLELKYADGVLEIPPLQLDSTTEIYARNLVAFEECHYREDPYITDYYILLSMLIKTVKDMDLLVREQIIDNWLDGGVATSMINKLPENRFYSKMNSDYQHIAEELIKFYNNPPKFIALSRALFRTRLTGATTISASFYLILSLVQAACSVLSLKYF